MATLWAGLGRYAADAESVLDLRSMHRMGQVCLALQRVRHRIQMSDDFPENNL
jgi:hypothetical protein